MLEEKIKNNEHDSFNEIMCDLDESEESDHFYSTMNSNGSGNNVDVLVVTHEGNVIFEHWMRMIYWSRIMHQSRVIIASQNGSCLILMFDMLTSISIFEARINSTT